MAPIMLAAELFEVVSQKRAHANDPICHALHLLQPLLIKPLVIEDV